MPAYVLDASPLLAWILPDENKARVAPLMARLQAEGAVAPRLLWSETRNVVLAAERRGRLSAADAEESFGDLSELPIDFDDAPDGLKTLRLARTHGLTIYDALYLELAARRSLPLATLDRRLAAAAVAEGIPVLPATSPNPPSSP